MASCLAALALASLFTFMVLSQKKKKGAMKLTNKKRPSSAGNQLNPTKGVESSTEMWKEMRQKAKSASFKR